jgi:hypothetical protein
MPIDSSVARQEEGGRVARELRVVGQRHRGRIDHHQAEGDQRQHHQHQGVVEVGQPRGARAAELHAVAHRQAEGAVALRPQAPRRPCQRKALSAEAGVITDASPRSAASARTASTKTSPRCT